MGLLRWKNLLLVVVALLVINLPLVHNTLENRRLDSSGVAVRAVVSDHRKVGSDYFLTFNVPADTPVKGDKKFAATARVDAHTYDVSVGSGVVEVRVLPGSTTNWRVDGQIISHLGLVITLIADLILALLVVLYVRFRSALRPELVLVADEDLERCPPGPVLDRLEGQRYVVCGEVQTIEGDEIVLGLGDRRVRVILDGHHNPAGYEQPVRATGMMIA